VVRNGVVLEFRDVAAGSLVGLVHVAEPAMFWSDARFERGETFASHADLFARLEEASRAFQKDGSGREELLELERIWEQLNERLEIRERDSEDKLTDVGLHLDGEQAQVRY
jgi:hypothetical protein